MEAIAKRDHAARAEAHQARGEAAERVASIVGREQHASRGEGRAFFQMQVSNDEGALRLPVESARGNRRERVSQELNRWAEGRRTVGNASWERVLTKMSDMRWVLIAS